MADKRNAKEITETIKIMMKIIIQDSKNKERKFAHYVETKTLY
ncbi:MAG: hypothetical protein ACLS5Y_01680 [Clostridia bacterium]